MERQPLGRDTYKIAISRAELSLLFKRRQMTGEPMQTFVRRLIRENWDRYDFAIPSEAPKGRQRFDPSAYTQTSFLGG